MIRSRFYSWIWNFVQGWKIPTRSFVILRGTQTWSETNSYFHCSQAHCWFVSFHQQLFLRQLMPSNELRLGLLGYWKTLGKYCMRPTVNSGLQNGAMEKFLRWTLKLVSNGSCWKLRTSIPSLDRLASWGWTITLILARESMKIGFIWHIPINQGIDPSKD